MQIKENNILAKSLYLFSVFMIAVYISFAIFLLSKEDLTWISNDNRKIFAGVLIAYAAFKIVRAYQQRHVFKKEDHEE